jgi:hypothetical protein
MTTARINAAGLFAFLGPVIAAAAAGGIVAVAAVMLARGIAGYGLVLWANRRQLGLGIREHVVVLRGVAPAAAVAWLAARGLVAALAGAPAPVSLVASSAAGLAVYLLVVRLLDPPLLARGLSQVRLALSRAAPSTAASAPA